MFTSPAAELLSLAEKTFRWLFGRHESRSDEGDVPSRVTLAANWD